MKGFGQYLRNFFSLIIWEFLLLESVNKVMGLGAVGNNRKNTLYKEIN